MTKKRVMIELDFILLRHIFVLEFLYCIWKREWILHVKSCVNEDMQDMCFGSQEALFMQVDAGRRKMLRIFYALQLVCKLTKSNYVHETTKLFLYGAVEGLYWPKWRLSDNQYPGAGRFKIEKRILKKSKNKDQLSSNWCAGTGVVLGCCWHWSNKRCGWTSSTFTTNKAGSGLGRQLHVQQHTKPSGKRAGKRKLKSKMRNRKKVTNLKQMMKNIKKDMW